jgi:hypothetical protein
LPALERAAMDSEPLISEHAAWAIRQIRARITPAGGISPPTRKGLNPSDLVVASI